MSVSTEYFLFRCELGLFRKHFVVVATTRAISFGKMELRTRFYSNFRGESISQAIPDESRENTCKYRIYQQLLSEPVRQLLLLLSAA